MPSLSFLLVLILTISLACGSADRPNNASASDSVNWAKRQTSLPASSSLQSGSTYLSVYSEIYAQSEHRTYPLTATVSMRNINSADSLYLRRATYYNTHGQTIRTYFAHPVLLLPMETLEIVIEEADTEGGSGANFVFEWSKPAGSADPYFEAVMISTSGQQGLSFTTRGVNR